MKWFLAHAGEEHDSIVESTSHNFEVDPFATAVIAVLVAILLVAGTQLVLKRVNITVLVALACLFVIGVFSYSAAPLLSALCIIAGFVLSLFLVFIGLVKG